MSIADKLQYTLNAKNAIKDALVAKGAITGTEPFDEYAGAIAEIKGKWDDYIGTDCKWTGDVLLPSSVTSVGSNAFSGCTDLISITIPNSVESMGDAAFYGCTNLTNITIPDSVTSIGEDAFSYCTNVHTVICQPTMPPNLGSAAFSNTHANLKIYVPNASVDAYKSATNWITYADRIEGFGDKVVIIPEGTTEIPVKAYYNNKIIVAVVVPNSVISIGNFAFYDCSYLTVINIPNGVTTIGQQAFSHCGSLRNIHIPDSVTSIGSYTFEVCGNLINANIPSSIGTIPSSMFQFCKKITKIAIPESVSKINNQAFQGCSSLTTVICKAKTPPTLGTTSFDSTPETMKIYVTDASVDAYKAATNWVAYADKILPLSQLPT